MRTGPATLALRARMAEWQTRRPQKPLSERACGFKSRSGHKVIPGRRCAASREGTGWSLIGHCCCDRAIHRRRYGCSRRRAGVFEQVPVAVHRERRGRVPKTTRDEKRLLPGCDQVGDVRVPEIVEPDARQAATGDPAIEDLGDALRIERHSVDVCENEVVVFVGATENEAVLSLSSALGPDNGRCGRVEVDRPPSTIRLRAGREDQLPVQGRELLSDVDPAPLEVDVGPPKTADLAAPHACYPGYADQGREGLASDSRARLVLR